MSVIMSDYPMSTHISDFVVLGKDCAIGEETIIHSFSNLYGCTLGDHCMVGTHCEIQKSVVIGNNVRIQSHSFICSGTTIGNDCFIGHGVLTINDSFSNGKVNYDSREWGKLVIEDSVIVGSGVVLFPVTVGHHAVIGAGAVVTKDVPPYTIVVGNPGRALQKK